MGLDGVELVMELEQEFRLSIPDADAERMTTVGHVVQWIAAKEGIGAQRSCPTAHMFFRLRRLLMTSFDAEREFIKPKARLAWLVPNSRHEELRRALDGLGLRPFMYPPDARRWGRWPGFQWVHFWLILLGVIVFLVLYFAGVHHLVILCGFCAISYGAVLSKAWRTRRERRKPIPAFATVADTVHGLCPAVAVVASDGNSSRLAEISHHVRELVAEQAGVPIEAISESTHFAHDLGW